MVRSYCEGCELFVKLILVIEWFLNVSLEFVVCILFDDNVC